MKLDNFTNDLFTFEKDKEGFTIILHEAEYNTEEVMNLFGWIHQIGVNYPEIQIKIGAKIK
jgi:hypothetical protein